MQHLRFLLLDALKNVTQIPDLSALRDLDTIWLETMRGITDLSPLTTAATLRRLAVINMTHLQPSAFEPLVTHPRLEEFVAGLGSDWKNNAVSELLPLPSWDILTRTVTEPRDFA
jgi:hypothetical protein